MKVKKEEQDKKKKEELDKKKDDAKQKKDTKVIVVPSVKLPKKGSGGKDDEEDDPIEKSLKERVAAGGLTSVIKGVDKPKPVIGLAVNVTGVKKTEKDKKDEGES